MDKKIENYFSYCDNVYSCTFLQQVYLLSYLLLQIMLWPL